VLEPRVGMAVLSQWNFDKDYARQTLEKCGGIVRSLIQQRCIVYATTISERRDALEAIDFFREKRVDQLILISGSFAPGVLAPMIASELGLPVLLWAVPEPPSHNRIVNTLSLCGANFNSSTLWKLHLPFDFVLLDAEAKNAGSELTARLRVLGAYHRFKHGRFGLIGYRVPGFYTSGFDELRLRRTFGAEVIQMDLAELFHRIDSGGDTSEEEISLVAERVLPKTANIEVAREKLRRSLLLFVALEKWVKEEGLQLLAVKCWPEFPSIRREMPCASMGWMTNSGIPAACEADMLGGASMLLAQVLTGKSGFIADLLETNAAENTLVFWHCGSAPAELAATPEIILEEHSRKPGIGSVGEFALAEGDVTILRISEGRSGYRVLAIPGHALPTDRVLRGNLVKVRIEVPVEEAMGDLIAAGFEHHYIIAYGSILGGVKSWARLFDVPVFDGKTWHLPEPR